jgi:putative hydrolase of the HAD superfamily
MSRTTPISGLILDYGGVVFHEDPADYEPIERSLGLSPGRLWTLVHTIPEYRPSRIGQLSSEEFELAVRAHLCRLSDPSRVDAALQALRWYYGAQDAVRAPMRELLAALKGRLGLVLLSNGTRGATQRLREKGLLDYVDAIVCSGDTGVAKPDAEAYHLATRGLGLNVAQCAFVDDVPENVSAARALGMQALLYHHTRHAELFEYLARWGYASD